MLIFRSLLIQPAPASAGECRGHGAILALSGGTELSLAALQGPVLLSPLTPAPVPAPALAGAESSRHLAILSSSGVMIHIPQPLGLLTT